MTTRQKNEGEGNKSADRAYREKTEEFVRAGKVQDAAEDARKAVEGDEGKALKEAEKAGQKRARH
ncbi:MAG: hypothetical protein GEU92_13710 [Alphaproteobacteria bacterium]|nr:hypothetical protein [Alphaproteobacteria bacterium]